MNLNPKTVFYLVATCVSCNQITPEIGLVRVPIDSLYSVSIPANLKPGYDMHDYASLQYYDSEIDFYVVGLEDAKENLGDIKRKRLKIGGYFDFVENTVMEKADSTFMEAYQKLNIDNGIKMRSGDYYVSSTYFGESYELFYRITVYESNNHFFQVVTWLPYSSHCNYINWVDNITHSFSVNSPPIHEEVGVR